MKDSLFLVLDGNALLHRAWHAIPPLATQDGTVVNAVYGFTNVIEKMLNVYDPAYIAVAWDLPGGTFRHEEFEEYKAQREKKPDELYAQIPMIQEMLLAYGIPSFSLKGFEADDILGTVSAMNEQKGLETLIVTGDLDSLQLVSAKTKVVFFVKGLSEVKIYDISAVHERYGLPPERLIDLKTLIGDTSDNLPGVPGIGEKSAAELLKAYGTVDGILEAFDAGTLPEKYVKKFTGQKKTVAQMKRLVTIVRDIPLKGFDYDVTKRKEIDVPTLVTLLKKYEFKTLLKKYDIANAEAPALPKKNKAKKAKMGSMMLVSKLTDLKGSRFGLMVDEKKQDLFGGALSLVLVTDGVRVYKGADLSTEQAKAVVEFLEGAQTLVGHDLKGMFHAFKRANVDVSRVVDKTLVDTMVAAYILAPGGRELAFTDVLNERLKLSLSEQALPEETVNYLLPLGDALLALLQKEGMKKLFEEIEMPVLPVLFRMECEGIAVDEKKLADLSEEFETNIDKLTKKIHKLAGKDFNVNSPSQLADILFVDLGLPTKGIKKTKSGYSTAAPELEKLEDEHEIVPLIAEYREIAKLKSTYADSLPTLVAKDGRIHTTYNQTVAATGRLSSTNPNMQNIPVRTELGREIRKAFIAPKGSVLLSADYSQIELRLAAVLAKDESFLSAFRDGADIHKRTAAEIYDVPEDKVTKEQREHAKATNFSILYGVGARALGKRTKMGYEEAKAFIERYFAVHPGISEFIDAAKMKARVDGYVETMFGRKRYLPDIQSGMPQLVAAAERMAMNMPVQGSNADIIKMAMIKMDEWLKKSGIKAKMLLQVHDELVFEVEEDAVEEAEKEIPKIMSGVVNLEIPLVVDTGTGKRWGEIE